MLTPRHSQREPPTTTWRLSAPVLREPPQRLPSRGGARASRLLDGYPGAAGRFAGEWIHPPGVRTLRSLGVDIGRLAACRGHGFAIFGDDGADPVCLPYGGDGIGIARQHEELVAQLREHARGQANVRYLPDHVVRWARRQPRSSSRIARVRKAL